jgi:isopenicillin N synthase-like dioxygenase
MGAMAAAASSPARVRLMDLVAADGLPSDAYKHAVAMLAQSLRNSNAAIIQLSPGDEVLLRCVLDSVRMFFHQKPIVGPELIHTEDTQDWNQTSGYFADSQHAREVYDYRPGRTNSAASEEAAEADITTAELPPAGLPELFALLGNVTRVILDAIGCSLELRSFAFTDLLDNMPLKIGEMSTSVLSTCCHNRPGAKHQGEDVALTCEQQGNVPLLDEDMDKGLLTLLKSDKSGLQIRDLQGRWIVVDADLGPQDMVLYSGLSLYQATGGYLSPAVHRTDNSNNNNVTAAAGQGQGSSVIPYGRCSIEFKLMPRASAILHCSAMTAAGHPVGSPFQQPVAVHDFMQRSHPMDQLLNRPGVPTFTFPTPPPPDGSIKSGMKRRKQVSQGKPLAPSKRLRLEAQRVLKERVQEIADSKGLKVRYCNLKECEEHHLHATESPCGVLRAEMGWPQGVPFVHPHDLPNKAKQAFLEAYEPGWTTAQDGELGSLESSQAQQALHALAGAPSVEDQRFTVKTVYDYLRAKGKPVPTGKPQVVGHKVDLCSLAKLAFEAGGRAQVVVH